MGDGEKLLTYLNSALKALLGFDIFPRVPKKSEILLCSVTGGPTVPPMVMSFSAVSSVG